MRLVVRIISVLFTLVLISACESTNVKPDQVDTIDQDMSSPEYINNLLDQAKSTEDPIKALSLQLNAAEILARTGNTDWARSIINNLPINANPSYRESPLITARRALIESYIYAADGYSPLAYENINSEAIVQLFPSLPKELLIPILELRAQQLFNMEIYPSSIEERIQINGLLPTDSIESEINQDKIWTALMEIPMESLEKLALSSKNREQLGWYTLASLSKNNQTNLRQQVQLVEQWIREWPEHPASLRPPADLQILQQLLDTQAKRIAILLPLSGRLSGAANAILDGFMAAYYELKSNGQETPLLRFYDTNDADIQQLYEQALFDGAELVIGPLEKSNIQKLITLPSIPIPTLALNSIDESTAGLEHFYQFGLGVEDDSESAAQKAWRDGHRRALIITSNNVWGDRATQAFEFAWIGLGGEISGDYRFEDTNDYSKMIETALQLDQSHERSREIRRIVGHIEFEPRRRQDIDMIFLAAQSKQARQVKPTLAFHYAGTIPVYATSHVYSGAPDPKLDQDMNGVRFSTLPWFFDYQSPEKKVLNKNTAHSPNLEPLYALGVDSFHIYPRLRQLETVKEAHFYGKTGQLSLDKQRKIKRKQMWVQFYRGKPRPLKEAN